LLFHLSTWDGGRDVFPSPRLVDVTEKPRRDWLTPEFISTDGSIHALLDSNFSMQKSEGRHVRLHGTVPEVVEGRCWFVSIPKRPPNELNGGRSFGLDDCRFPLSATAE
jgi:hypothetical protein